MSQTATHAAASDGDFAHQPATVRLGDLKVCRLGFGAMRLPGKDVWGEPEDPDNAKAVLRRAVALGIKLFVIEVRNPAGIEPALRFGITGHATKSEGEAYGVPEPDELAEAIKRFPRYDFVSRLTGGS